MEHDRATGAPSPDDVHIEFWWREGSMPRGRKSRQIPLVMGLFTFIATLQTPAAATPAPMAYVTNQDANTISVIDTTTNAVVATVSLSTPSGVAVTPDGTRAYVASLYGNSVVAIDTATNSIVATIGVGSYPWGVAVAHDGSRVYVANLYSNSVSVIDRATNTVVDTIAVGSVPYEVAFTPDGARAYVTNDVSDSVSVIDTATRVVVATVPVGSAPTGIAVTPDGSKVYVANNQSGTVSVIATATNTVVATVTVGNPYDPYVVAVSPDGSRVYVVNYGGAATNNNGNMTVIATATNTVVAGVAVGKLPYGVALTRDGAHAYVTNSLDATVAVISTATNLLIATIGVGGGTNHVAIQPAVTVPLHAVDHDFNGDGKADILWSNPSTGAVAMWLMNGGGVLNNLGFGNMSPWEIAGDGDFNGDGKADILWWNPFTGNVALWLMNGGSVVHSVGFGNMWPWTIAGVGDFNGDGKADILWSNAVTGAVSMWLINGGSVVANAGFGNMSPWTVVGVGDFNGDGKADILWSNSATGAVSMWLMNGASVLAGAGFGNMSPWTVVGVGDFNGDGKADILWWNPVTGNVAMWLMNGGAVLDSAGFGNMSPWVVVGVGDFNGDGKADILWSNASTGAMAMWLMNGGVILDGSGFGVMSPWITPWPMTTLSGNVAAVGTVAGATLRFFELHADGSKGRSLGTTTTDTDGLYQITLASAKPILVEASGGSYVNTANGATDSLLPTDTLTAVLPGRTTQAAITPLTHMAAARARVLSAAGVTLANAVAAANTGIAQQYLLTDIVGVLPVDADDAARVGAASREQRNYAIVLAGLGREALDLNVRPIDLAVALAEDMADGVLDGFGFPASSWMGAGNAAGQSAPQRIHFRTISGAVVDLPTTAGVAALQHSIDVFLASQLNLTNLAGKNIGSMAVNINPLGGDFFIAATALPAWREGNPGTAPIRIVGGTPPYSCVVTPGSALPAWLSLGGSPATGWALAGTAPVLPAGSTMRIEPPFSVTCSDSTPATNGGPHSQAIQWTVTIVKAPPQLIAIPVACVPGTLVDVPIATANGGVPPYYFKSASFRYGAPPFGMAVAPNGNIKGNCNPPGVVPIDVVDSIGAAQDPPEPIQSSLTACSASIAPTSQSFSASGGSGSVTVTTSESACVWRAASNSSWIAITGFSPSSGTASYSVTANTGTSQRTGTLTIAGQTFTVVQDPPSCTFSIAPTSQSFGSTGGTGSVTVTVANGCAWTAVSNASWITITGGSSGSGNGTVSYSVAANTGTSQRSGSMTIAGQSFVVTQSGASACRFKGSMSGTWSTSACGANGTFSVTIDAACHVAGSYSGAVSGGISGSVDSSGTLAAGTTSGGSWNGTLSTSGSTMSGSGTFSDSGCSGGWSGSGSLSP